MQFEFAQHDAEQAAAEQDYEFHIFQLPNPKGDGTEDYCAVKPSEELLLTLTQDVYLLQERPAESIDVLNRVMLQVLNDEDIREALLEAPEYADKYADKEGDGDGELNAWALSLVSTRHRLAYRRSVNPKRDPLGTVTLANVAVWLIEKWSGKDTGKPQDFQPPSKPTGARSKRASSSRAGATRSNSSRRSASAGS